MPENKDILEAFQWRYATKKFDPLRKIPQGDWHALEESLRLAPSSYGIQPWNFLLVQDPGLRRRLTSVSWDQAQVESCSHFIVLTHLNRVSEAHAQKHAEAVSAARGADLEKTRQRTLDLLINRKDMPAWAARQCYIAMGCFMTAAAVMGIDTCPMEGIEKEKYDEILGLQGTEFSTVAALAAGYRAAEDGAQNLKKARLDRKDVFREM